MSVDEGLLMNEAIFMLDLFFAIRRICLRTPIWGLLLHVLQAKTNTCHHNA